MDASALASTIKGLETSLDYLGGLLTFWTSCVVIGLVVEYLPETVKALRARPVRWSDIKAIVGGFLVTAGVAGELVIGFRASGVETSLRSKNAEAFATLNKEASDARTIASGADERAAVANRDAADARVQAGKAIERAAANEKAAEDERLARTRLEQAVSRQRELTAKAETSLLQLQERIKPRAISPELRAKLTDALRLSAHKGRIQLDCILGDTEGCWYAAEIRTCLEAAGWPLETMRGLPVGGMQGFTAYGLMILVTDPKAAPLFAADLQTALLSVGLKAVAGNGDPQIPSDRVILFIGTKP
jgi:hypothetical protein